MNESIPFNAYKVTEAVGGHVASFPFGTGNTHDRFSFTDTQLEALIDTTIQGAIAVTIKAIEPSLTPVQLIQESVKKSKSANIPQFPTTIRKMWSGSEVQDWINKNWNTVNND